MIQEVGEIGGFRIIKNYSVPPGVAIGHSCSVFVPIMFSLKSFYEFMDLQKKNRYTGVKLTSMRQLNVF